MRSDYQTKLTALGVSVVLSSLLGSAVAQEATDEEADDAETARDIEMVIVTTERREQDLQNVAGTVAVLTGEDMKRVGILNIQDLNNSVPGLQINRTEGNVEVFIRGVGSTNNTELGQPSIATYIDGVYVPRPRGYGSAFFDVNRVEVNIGPQGTLRGRNSLGGSVDVIPWKPSTSNVNGAFEVGNGNFNALNMEGAVNLPINEQHAIRFAGKFFERDPLINNLTPCSNSLGVSVSTCEDEGILGGEAREDLAGRVSYLYEPNDRFDFLLTADYIEEGGTGYQGVNFAPYLLDGGDIDEVSSDDYRNVFARAYTPEQDTQHWGVKAEVNYDFSFATLQYIYGRRDIEDVTRFPLTGNFLADTNYENSQLFRSFENSASGRGIPTAVAEEEFFDNFGQLQFNTDSISETHELRFHEYDGVGLDWTAGVFYFQEEQKTYFGLVADRNLNFSGLEFNTLTDTESYAGFVDATYNFSDQLRITGGIRYTDESKTREGIAISNIGIALGGVNFSCCGGVRIGTPGFAFNAFNRTIYNPDADGDGAVTDQEQLDLFLDGFASFGSNDTVLQTFPNRMVTLGGQGSPLFFGSGETGAQCIDTIAGDFFVCPADGLATFAVPFAGGVALQNGRADFDFVDWRIRLEYDLSPDRLVYASISTGHSSGGFNDNLPGTEGFGTSSPFVRIPVPFDSTTLVPVFDEENNTVFEIGTKNEYRNRLGRGKLNLSGFAYLFEDKVENVIIPISDAAAGLVPDEVAETLPGTLVSRNLNVGDAVIAGAQLEFGQQLSNGLNFDSTFLWMPEANYRDDVKINDPRFGTGIVTAERDMDGLRLIRTPEWQLRTSLSQSLALGSGEAFWIVSLGWRSSQHLNLMNGLIFDDNPAGTDTWVQDRVPDYLTMDLGAGYAFGNNAQYRFEVYAQNATDAQEAAGMLLFDGNNHTRFFIQPRTFGARLRVTF